jgi:menaquinone-9 beta-reductase
MENNHYDIAIIGGGPAGSTAGLYLARKGFSVCLIEKKIFPREVLCGEFLSREVSDILRELDLTEQLLALQPNPISVFRFCPDNSRSFSAKLPFTGYGIKRGAFDELLLRNAQTSGVEILQPATVEQINRKSSGFEVTVKNLLVEKIIHARHVIAAYGKFNILDKSLRTIIPVRSSNLNGIKFHVPKKYLRNYPENEIHIFTTERLYCGVNVVNDDTVTMCFIEQRSSSDAHPRERLVQLFNSNHHFRTIVTSEFTSAMDSFPIYGTSNIFFGKKNLVENGIFMIGDAARVIAPLSGDGIGMALQSGKLIAEVFEEGRKKNFGEKDLESTYSALWHSYFQRRLLMARAIQKLFLSNAGRKIGNSILSQFPNILNPIIHFTRG